MANSTLSRGLATTGVVGLGSASLLGASAAFAAPGDCTYPGSTEVVTGICQIVFTTNGTVNFPTNLTKVAAVLVGGGGGGSAYNGPYGGGGGEVTYVDSVTLGTSLNVSVGSGGAAGSGGTVPTPAGDGEDSAVGPDVAHGGMGADSGNAGASGNGHLGYDSISGSGGGAAGDATDEDIPGPGYLLSTIPSIDSDLFPPAADGSIEYGRGGTGVLFPLTPVSDAIANSGHGGSADIHEESPPGGGPDVNVQSAKAGAAGVVIFRYASGLANTGTDSTGVLAVGSTAAILGAGLLATSVALRRRDRKA